MSCIILDQNAMDCNPINVQPHLQAGLKRPAPEQTSEKPTQSTRSTTEMNIQALQAELLQLTQGFHFIADQNRHLQSTVQDLRDQILPLDLTTRVLALQSQLGTSKSTTTPLTIVPVTRKNPPTRTTSPPTKKLKSPPPTQPQPTANHLQSQPSPISSTLASHHQPAAQQPSPTYSFYPVLRSSSSNSSLPGGHPVEVLTGTPPGSTPLPLQQLNSSTELHEPNCRAPFPSLRQSVSYNSSRTRGNDLPPNNLCDQHSVKPVRDLCSPSKSPSHQVQTSGSRSSVPTGS
jgi:hypothetical protein